MSGNNQDMSRSQYWALYKELYPVKEDREFTWAGKGHSKLIKDYIDKLFGIEHKPVQKKHRGHSSRSEYWRKYKALVPNKEDREFKWSGKGHSILIKQFVDNKTDDNSKCQTGCLLQPEESKLNKVKDDELPIKSTGSEKEIKAFKDIKSIIRDNLDMFNNPNDNRMLKDVVKELVGKSIYKIYKKKINKSGASVTWSLVALIKELRDERMLVDSKVDKLVNPESDDDSDDSSDFDDSCLDDSDNDIDNYFDETVKDNENDGAPLPPNLDKSFGGFEDFDKTTECSIKSDHELRGGMYVPIKDMFKEESESTNNQTIDDDYESTIISTNNQSTINDYESTNVSTTLDTNSTSIIKEIIRDKNLLSEGWDDLCSESSEEDVIDYVIKQNPQIMLELIRRLNGYNDTEETNQETNNETIQETYETELIGGNEDDEKFEVMDENELYTEIKNKNYPSIEFWNNLREDIKEFVEYNLENFAPLSYARFKRYLRGKLIELSETDEKFINNLILSSNYGEDLPLDEWNELTSNQRKYFKQELRFGERGRLERFKELQEQRREQEKLEEELKETEAIVEREIGPELEPELPSISQFIPIEETEEEVKEEKEKVPLVKEVDINKLPLEKVVEIPSNLTTLFTKADWLEKFMIDNNIYHIYNINAIMDNYIAIFTALNEAWKHVMVDPNEAKIVVKTILKTNQGTYEERLNVFDYVGIVEHLKNIKEYFENLVFSSEEITSKTEVIKRLANVLYLSIEKVNEDYMSLYKRRFGGFCKFTHNLPFDLKPFGIYTKEELLEKEFKDNCLIEALINKDGHDKRVDDIRIYFASLNVKKSDLKFVAENRQEIIEIKYMTKSQTRCEKYGDKYKTKTCLGLVDDHYFINEKEFYLNISPFALSNYDKIKHYDRWWLAHKISKNGKIKRKIKSKIEPYKFIKWLSKRKDLIEMIDGHMLNIKFSQLNKLKGKSDKVHLSINNIEEQEQYKQKKLFKGEYFDVCAFDFETATKAENTDRCIKYSHLGHIIKDLDLNTYHARLCVSYTLNGNEPVNYIGRECAFQMLEDLENNTLMIAHNATYDYLQLFEYLYFNNKPIFNKKTRKYHYRNMRIWKDEHLMQGEFTYIKTNGKRIKIIIKDSYALISTELRKFPEMFKLKGIQKEAFPYDLYCSPKILGRKKVRVSEALMYIHKEEDVNQFLENIKDKIIIEDNFKYFDHIEYMRFYCNQDVRVLYEGITKFRKQVLEMSNNELDIYEIPSAASLAHRYHLLNGSFDGIYKLNGYPAFFIRNTVVGGLVMTNDNNKIKIEDGKVYINGELKPKYKRESIAIADNDVNSLYPAAMVRLGGYLKGTPKIIEKENLNYEWLQNNTDGYFVDIKITKVNKHRNMPCIPIKMLNENNLPENRYDDRLWAIDNLKDLEKLIDKEIHVNKISLEDLVKYHDIEFKIIKGYYYNEGRNQISSEITQDLFDLRLKFKDKSNYNPIEQVYKLIMNSSYGKTIMKPPEVSVKFFDSYKEMMRYYMLNYKAIKVAIRLGNTNKWRIEIINSIKDFSSYPHVGSEILAMSKRIMNEIKYLADDNDIPIFYQDTDSMHLFQSDLTKLQNIVMKEMNGYEMQGKLLGQFSSDFKISKNKKEKEFEPYADMAVYLGKKCYMMRIVCNSKNEKEYHCKMKGVSQEAIEYCQDFRTRINKNGTVSSIKREKKLTIEEIYLKLYNNEEMIFDLLAGGKKVRFKQHKNGRYTRISTFTRTIKFITKEDKIEEN